MGFASQDSTLPCAIATFSVSLSLSSPGDVRPRLPLLPSTRPWTSAHPPWPPQPKPQPLTPSISNPPLCQTPGCRSVHSRSTLTPSHPVLSALRLQGFRTWFALATARRSFGGASPPIKVFSCATLSQCSHTGLSQGHSCTRSSGGLVSCAAPRWCEVRPGGVRYEVWRSVPGGGSTYCIHTEGLRLLRALPSGSWGRARLSVGRRAPVSTTWCASSMRGSAWRFQRTYPGFRSRRPLGRWRIAPVCRFAGLLRFAPSSAVYAVGAYTWSPSSSPTRLTRMLGKPLR